eukprot:COSAG01_NODE_1007_length_12161_cov_12.669624_16_plen_52_part_00
MHARQLISAQLNTKVTMQQQHAVLSDTALAMPARTDKDRGHLDQEDEEGYF